jgi:acyl carrier protein
MVPSAYRTVNAFPMTINGKIDTKALNIDLSQSMEEGKVNSKDLTPTQLRLVKIWQELIKTNSIFINDNFFDVGGTSLLAIRAVDRIEKEFNIKLSLRVFFDCPKIQGLAEHIDSRMSSLKVSVAADTRQLKRSDKIVRGEI